MLTTGIILSMVFIIPVGIFVFCIILPIIDDYESESEYDKCTNNQKTKRKRRLDLT